MSDLTVADELAWERMPQDVKDLGERYFREHIGEASNYEVFEEGRREGIEKGRAIGWREGFAKGVKVGKTNQG